MLGIAESNPDTGDSINPCFQLHGHAKVIHRCTQDEDISGLQFRNQIVVKGNAGRLSKRALFCRSEQCIERRFISEPVFTDYSLAYWVYENEQS